MMEPVITLIAVMKISNSQTRLAVTSSTTQPWNTAQMEYNNNPGSNDIMCGDMCIDIKFWCYERAGNTAFCSNAGISTVYSILLCSNHIIHFGKI